MLSARLHLYPPANFLIFHIDFEPTMRYLHKLKRSHLLCSQCVQTMFKSSIEFLRIFTIIGIIKYFLQIYKKLLFCVSFVLYHFPDEIIKNT